MAHLNCRQSPTNHAHYSTWFRTPIGHSHSVRACVFVPLAPDSVGDGVMFSACPVRLFVLAHIVTTISHERLEQC